MSDEQKYYIVGVKEIHISHRRVAADSIEEAIEEAAGEGEEIDLIYCMTMDSETWDVYEVDENDIEILVD